MSRRCRVWLRQYIHIALKRRIFSRRIAAGSGSLAARVSVGESAAASGLSTTEIPDQQPTNQSFNDFPRIVRTEIGRFGRGYYEICYGILELKVRVDSRSGNVFSAMLAVSPSAWGRPSGAQSIEHKPLGDDWYKNSRSCSQMGANISQQAPSSFPAILEPSLR